MAVQAIAKSIKLSPRKVGVVASLVRGRTVADALVILEHTPRRPASALATVIKSAQANASNNHRLDPAQLTIVSLEVGPGPMMKRYRPAAHGRALPYRKRSSNIRVVVDGPAKAASKPKTAKTTAKPEPKDEEETK